MLRYMRRVRYETEQYNSYAFCVFACVEIKGLVIVPTFI